MADSNVQTVESFFATEEMPSSVKSWELAASGDAEGKRKFLSDIDKTIDKAINAYAGGNTGLKTQARIIALDAVKDYNPKAGASIDTYIFGQLRRLQRLSAQRGNLTRLSENVAQQRSVVARAIRELTADTGEDPTTEQIANKTGLSRKRIDALMNYKPIVPDSVATSPEGDSLVAANNEVKMRSLYNDVIYNELDDTDKKIYEWVTGYGKGEKLNGTQIAAKLGISPAAVSKRYSKLVDKFNRDYDVIRRTINAAD